MQRGRLCVRSSCTMNECSDCLCVICNSIIIIITATMLMVLSSWPKSLREFTRFIWWMQTECRVAANPQTKPVDSGMWVRRKLAAVIHIHHRHCYYYSARRLILILPSHEGWKAESTYRPIATKFYHFCLQWWFCACMIFLYVCLTQLYLLLLVFHHPLSISRLKTFLPSHCSLSFSSSGLTTWFPGLLLLLLSISVFTFQFF